MTRRKLIWQIYPSQLALILISLLALSWYISRSLREFYLDEVSRNLKVQGHLLENQLLGLLSPLDPEKVQSLCQRWGKKTSLRATVILPSGKVVGDSEEEPSRMENHAARLEIDGALQRGAGLSLRYSRTVQKKMMYVALPLFKEKHLQGIVRLSLSVSSMEETFSEIFYKIAFFILLIALVAAFGSLHLSWRIAQPLTTLEEGARKMGEGDLSITLPPSDLKEIHSLSQTMNQMALQLRETLQRVYEQKEELSTILSSMEEGVISFDHQGKVLSINQKGRDLLEITTSEVRNRPLLEMVRNRELEGLVQKTLSSGEMIQEDFLFRGREEKVLQAQGIPLKEGHHRGSLLVIQDVTRLRKLERMRQDFVANVSHELKTPVTSIKGFVETLLDGAMKNPEDLERFLQIIARQSHRLHLIIEDLLSLSRIERESEMGQVELKDGLLEPVLRNALQSCELQAREKTITLELSCPAELRGRINPPLLEQALTNLIDNAIKYSPAGKAVRVEGSENQEGILLQVRDQGPGIGSHHLPRLFERFYRADKARSRKLGGTGLGLSIVKHIVLAHGGEVGVKSKVGEGSLFSIGLPRKN